MSQQHQFTKKSSPNTYLSMSLETVQIALMKKTERDVIHAAGSLHRCDALEHRQSSPEAASYLIPKMLCTLAVEFRSSHTFSLGTSPPSIKIHCKLTTQNLLTSLHTDLLMCCAKITRNPDTIIIDGLPQWPCNSPIPHASADIGGASPPSSGMFIVSCQLRHLDVI